MAEAELRALLADLRHVARNPFAADWPRTFAASVVRQAANPNWRPSVKQAAIMRRIAREAREAREARGDDFQVIDAEDGGVSGT